MAFAEVGFKFKVGDKEKEEAEDHDPPYTYTYNGFFPGSKVRNEFINEKPSPGLFRKKPITTEIGYEVVQDGKNEVVQDGSAETDLIPIWTGYLNQFVDKDNQFYEGSNPMNDGELDSFNYIQDHKDESTVNLFFDPNTAVIIDMSNFLCFFFLLLINIYFIFFIRLPSKKN